MTDDPSILPIAETEPEPTRPDRRGFLVVAGLIVALLAGAGFALAYLVPASNTPEEAVREFVTAITEEDLLGALDALAPAERDILRDAVLDITEELRRLEVLDDDADPNAIDGVDLGIEDLTLTAQPLGGEGLSLVTVSGTATFRVDPTAIPVGDVVGEDAAPQQLEERERIDNLQLVAVEEGGRWYVSLSHSLADLARREADRPPPDLAARIEADGAPSPEDAVRELIDAGRTVDPRKALALLPPDEARALHDYASLYLPDLEDQADDARKTFDADVRDLDLESDRDGDEATVRVTRFHVDATSDGDDLSVDYDGRCFTIVDDDGEEERQCGGAAASPLLLFPLVGPGARSSDAEVTDEQPIDLSLVTVQREGGWYVSPLRTVVRSIVQGLRSLERNDLEDLVQGFTQPRQTTTNLAGSDVDAEERLQAALNAFEASFAENGTWPPDDRPLDTFDRSFVTFPYQNVIPPPPFVVFEVDGDILRLATKGPDGCRYAAHDGTDAAYAHDAACGPPADQAYERR